MILREKVMIVTKSTFMRESLIDISMWGAVA